MFTSVSLPVAPSPYTTWPPVPPAVPWIRLCKVKPLSAYVLH